MSTTIEFQSISSSYSAQQDIGTLQQEIETKEGQAVKGGRVYPFRLIGPWVSEEWKQESTFAIFWKLEYSQEQKTGKEAKKKMTKTDKDILEAGKKYYEEHKNILLKKYIGKYIAILNNRVIGSSKDFSKLAQRIYKKYGYQTIYMPFVEAEKKIVKIPSPRIKFS